MESIQEEVHYCEGFRFGLIDAFEAYTRTKHAQDRIFREQMASLNQLIEKRIEEGLMYAYIDGQFSPRIRQTLMKIGYKIYIPTDRSQVDKNAHKYVKIEWDHQGMYPPREYDCNEAEN